MILNQSNLHLQSHGIKVECTSKGGFHMSTVPLENEFNDMNLQIVNLIKFIKDNQTETLSGYKSTTPF